MKKILLISEDVPNKVQLLHAISRLTRDYETLLKVKGKNDTEDPKSLIATASFLDMLVRRESRNLEKGNLMGDIHILSAKKKFITYLLSITASEASEVINSLKEEIDQNGKSLAHI